jgi:hypothetical protein
MEKISRLSASEVKKVHFYHVNILMLLKVNKNYFMQKTRENYL